MHEGPSRRQKHLQKWSHVLYCWQCVVRQKISADSGLWFSCRAWVFIVEDKKYNKMHQCVWAYACVFVSILSSQLANEKYPRFVDYWSQAISSALCWWLTRKSLSLFLNEMMTKDTISDYRCQLLWENGIRLSFLSLFESILEFLHHSHFTRGLTNKWKCERYRYFSFSQAL